MHAIAFRIARLVFWAALAVYIGGMIALGAVAAPAIFRSLEASGVADPRKLGGDVFGNVLSRFGYLELFAGLTMVAALVAESLLLRGAMLRKPWHLLRIGLVLCSLGLLFYDRVVVIPNVVDTRDKWYAAEKAADAAMAPIPPSTTPATRQSADPALKASFDAAHAASESLAHTKVYFLLAILILTALANTYVPPMLPRKPKPVIPTPPAQPSTKT